MVRAPLLLPCLGTVFAECESGVCPQKDSVLLQTKGSVAKLKQASSNLGDSCSCISWQQAPCDECGQHNGEPLYCCDNSDGGWVANFFYRNGHPCEQATYPAGATGGKCSLRGPVYATTTTTTTTTTTQPAVEQHPCGTNIARGKEARCYGRYMAVKHHCHGPGAARITDGVVAQNNAPRFEISDFSKDDAVIIDLGAMTAVNKVTLHGKPGRSYYMRRAQIGREFAAGTFYETWFEEPGRGAVETEAGTAMRFPEVRVGRYIKVWSGRSDQTPDADFLEVEVTCVDDPMCCASGQTEESAAADFASRFSGPLVPEASCNAPIELNFKHTPINMAGQVRSVEGSLEACQSRCAGTTGCTYFSWWPDGGCHLQDASARKVAAWNVATGRGSC